MSSIGVISNKKTVHILTIYSIAVIYFFSWKELKFVSLQGETSVDNEKELVTPHNKITSHVSRNMNCFSSHSNQNIFIHREEINQAPKNNLEQSPGFQIKGAPLILFWTAYHGRYNNWYRPYWVWYGPKIELSTLGL